MRARGRLKAVGLAGSSGSQFLTEVGWREFSHHLLFHFPRTTDEPLRREFEHVLRDLKSGLNRTEALYRMDDRLRVKEVTNLVSTVVQAERMGSGLAKSLRFQSEQRRSERFQRAEKQAMEAPVKLVFPLLMFIFPITFIVLGFPIAMKFVQEGLL